MNLSYAKNSDKNKVKKVSDPEYGSFGRKDIPCCWSKQKCMSKGLKKTQPRLRIRKECQETLEQRHYSGCEELNDGQDPDKEMHIQRQEHLEENIQETGCEGAKERIKENA